MRTHRHCTRGHLYMSRIARHIHHRRILSHRIGEHTDMCLHDTFRWGRKCRIVRCIHRRRMLCHRIGEHIGTPRHCMSRWERRCRIVRRSHHRRMPCHCRRVCIGRCLPGVGYHCNLSNTPPVKPIESYRVYRRNRHRDRSGYFRSNLA